VCWCVTAGCLSFNRFLPLRRSPVVPVQAKLCSWARVLTMLNVLLLFAFQFVTGAPETDNAEVLASVRWSVTRCEGLREAVDFHAAAEAPTDLVLLDIRPQYSAGPFTRCDRNWWRADRRTAVNHDAVYAMHCPVWLQTLSVRRVSGVKILLCGALGFRRDGFRSKLREVVAGSRHSDRCVV
jgi:hypothetical protein